MGAYLLKFPRNKITTLIFFGFVFFVDVPAVFMLGYWFLIQVFSGVGSVGYTNVSQGGTAWFAHMGGFLAGMVLVRLMSEERPAVHAPPRPFLVMRRVTLYTRVGCHFATKPNR